MAIRRGVITLLTAILAVFTIVMTATLAQAATFHPVKNWGNNKCLDVATQNNYLVQLWKCSNAAEQQWWTTDLGGGAIALRNNRTQGCLGVDGHSTAAQARVVSQPCGTVSTSWRIIFNNFGGQQLRNENSQLCLDLQENAATTRTIDRRCKNEPDQHCNIRSCR